MQLKKKRQKCCLMTNVLLKRHIFPNLPNFGQQHVTFKSERKGILYKTKNLK